jgi:Rrf2 family protein
VSVALNVATRGGREPVTAAGISEGCKFPPRFLYRILRRLVDSHVLTGTSGPGGGYRLARSPRQITLLQIVEAVEGPQLPTKLAPVCGKHGPAIGVINEICSKSADDFRRALARTTLDAIQKAASKQAVKRGRRGGKGKKRQA